MATIKELMPYLERGYQAADMVRMGPAYLTPEKQPDGTLLFHWLGYEMEGDWSGPDTYTQEEVSKWKSDNWGILCGSADTEEEKEDIEQAIANGLAQKAKGFE